MATAAHEDGAVAGNDVSQDAVKPRSGIAARWEDWVEEQKRKNDERASKPDNIVVSKFAVALCVGLLVWCYYVYVGRICTPMIRRDPAARGSRAQGVVFLVFFNILWLLMAYTYAAVCLTPPGFARDYLEQGPEPDPPWAAPQPAPWQGSRMNGGSDNVPQTTMAGMNGPVPPIQHPMDDTEHVAESMPQAGALGTGIARAVAIVQQPQDNQASANQQVEQQPIDESMHNPRVATSAQNGHSAPPFDKSVQNGPPRMPDPAAQPAGIANPNTHGREFRASNQPVKPFPRVFREPPQRLALHPHTRYCRRCRIVKPPRTHHCRHCGTCVLNMDHHCPWIGQCCGARNHIYFLAFCFWAAIALTYIFITVLIAIIAPNASPDPNELDAQSVVICAIAAVLGFFTASMAVTHYTLIITAQSTIENISIGDMKYREKASLNREYPIFAFKDKQRERKLMEQTWGKLDTEANLWWQGSKMENWKITMGPGVLKWILPPPKYTPDDGLHYMPNPRRGPMGLWRMRQDWPSELQ